MPFADLWNALQPGVVIRLCHASAKGHEVRCFLCLNKPVDEEDVLLLAWIGSMKDWTREFIDPNDKGFWVMQPNVCPSLVTETSYINANDIKDITREEAEECYRSGSHKFRVAPGRIHFRMFTGIAGYAANDPRSPEFGHVHLPRYFERDADLYEKW